MEPKQRITNLSKDLGLKEIGVGQLKFKESDLLYQRFQKLIKYIYKNGEWADDDFEESIIDRHNLFILNNNPELKEISMQDEKLPYYPTIKKLGNNTRVYQYQYDMDKERIGIRNIFIDMDNRMGSKHGKVFLGLPKGYRGTNEKAPRRRKEFYYNKEGIIFNADKLIGFHQLKKALFKEYDKQEEKIRFSKGDLNNLLELLISPEVASKKSMLGLEIMYATKPERKFLDDYIHSVYNVVMQREYEADNEIRLKADFTTTKANINESTKQVMKTTSLNKNFRFVELDNEVDLKRFSSFEKEMGRIQSILPKVVNKQPELRLRKLGNHKVLGLYTPFFNTIALDFRSHETVTNGYRPDGVGIEAFIHEYGHFLDYKFNPELTRNSSKGNLDSMSLQEDFKPIRDKYVEQLKKNKIYDVSTGKVDHYFAVPTEIFARAFELYTKDQGLNTSLIHTNEHYQKELEYVSFTPEIREEITQYFDNKFPEYAQRIKQLEQENSKEFQEEVSVENELKQESLQLLAEESLEKEETVHVDLGVEEDKPEITEKEETVSEVLNKPKQKAETTVDKEDLKQTKSEEKIEENQTENLNNSKRKTESDNEKEKQENKPDLKVEGEELYALRRAKGKLERLEREYREAKDALFGHMRQANGQPMNDKRGGASFFKRNQQLEEKAFNLMNEIKEQKERVERLIRKEERKRNGLNRQGGLEMSVNNIPRIKEEIRKAELGESSFRKETINKYKKELVKLEKMAKLADSKLTPAAQKLVDDGLVNQWKKKPTFYFVKGLRKVALEVTEEGNFKASDRYFPKNDEEKKIVDELLAKQNEAVVEEEKENTHDLEEKEQEIESEREETKEESFLDKQETDEEVNNKKEKEKQEEKEAVEEVKSEIIANEVEEVTENLAKDLENSGLVSGLVEDVKADTTEEELEQENVEQANETKAQAPVDTKDTAIQTSQAQKPKALTSTEIDQALNKDIFAVANKIGIELVQNRGRYYWKEEPTFEILKDKLFTWKDKDIYHANVVRLVQTKLSLKYDEAVRYLNETEIPDVNKNDIPYDFPNKKVVNEAKENNEPASNDNQVEQAVKENQVSKPTKTTRSYGGNFSKAKETAKNRDILEVADKLGMNLRRMGQNYQWVDHDSLTIFPRTNTYKWFSRDVGGDTISLVQEVSKDFGKDLDFNGAMNFLLADDFTGGGFTRYEEPEKRKFEYKLKDHTNINRGMEFLTKVRGLDPKTVEFFANKGVLTQATRMDKHNNLVEPVVVFKHFDKDKLVGASLQGIDKHPEVFGERQRRKEIVANSAGNVGMNVTIGKKAERVIVFESPIDMMSYYEIKNARNELKDVMLFSMNGLKNTAASKAYQMWLNPEYKPENSQENFLEYSNKTMDLYKIPYESMLDSGATITYAVDNDDSGMEFCKKMTKNYPNIAAKYDLPPKAIGQEKMDWNEYLIQLKKAGKPLTQDLEKVSVPKEQKMLEESQVARLIKAKPILDEIKGRKEKEQENSQVVEFKEEVPGEELKHEPITESVTANNAEVETKQVKETPVETKEVQKSEEVQRPEAKPETKEDSKTFNYQTANGNELSNQAMSIVENLIKDPKTLNEYMDMLGKFPEFTPRNVALIYAQAKEKNLDINKLGTYEDWNKRHDIFKLTKDDIVYDDEIAKKLQAAGREYEQKLSVKAGEQGQITLFRPKMITKIPRIDLQGNVLRNENGKIRYKAYKANKLTEQEQQLLDNGAIELKKVPARDNDGKVIFQTYKLFDISQTTLKPESYSKIVGKHLYDYKNDKSKLYKVSYALKEYAKQKEIKYMIDKNHITDLKQSQSGGYNGKGKIPIVVMNGNVTRSNGFEENLGRAVTLISHGILHADRISKIDPNRTPRQQGLEAEILGHAVAAHFGLKTETRWLDKMAETLPQFNRKELSESLARVHKESKEYIKHIAKYGDSPKRTRNRSKQRGNTQEKSHNRSFGMGM